MEITARTLWWQSTGSTVPNDTGTACRQQRVTAPLLTEQKNQTIPSIGSITAKAS